VLNAAAAAFYYLRVAVYMYMREPQSEAPPLAHSRLLWGGLAAATALTILLGLFPGPFLDIVNQAAQAIA
jgi:NADH-quinone oxidoreductase subunit N